MRLVSALSTVILLAANRGGPLPRMPLPARPRPSDPFEYPGDDD